SSRFHYKVTFVWHFPGRPAKLASMEHARLLRYIFRLDYEVNYDLINRPGDVLRVVQEGSDSFWDRVGETRNSRNVSMAKSTRIGDNVTNYHCSIEPQSFNGSLEALPALPCSDTLNIEAHYLNLCSRISRLIFEQFRI